MNKLNGFNNGRDTTDELKDKSSWYFDENNKLVVIHEPSHFIDASKKIDIPNPADKGRIIYYNNGDIEVSRYYLNPKVENPG